MVMIMMMILLIGTCQKLASKTWISRVNCRYNSITITCIPTKTKTNTNPNPKYYFPLISHHQYLPKLNFYNLIMIESSTQIQQFKRRYNIQSSRHYYGLWTMDYGQHLTKYIHHINIHSSDELDTLY
jgi:hypothetical protein